MTAERSVPAKIARPSPSFAVDRERLFRLLDDRTGRPVVWLSSPAGSGKTTLVSGYLESRKTPCLWYRCDEGDSDLATFFYYMGLAAGIATPRARTPLPLLTPEYLGAIPTFARRYFERLFSRLMGGGRPGMGKRRFCVVLDNYQEVPVASPFHTIIAAGLDAIPEGIRVIVISRGEPPPPLARTQANDRMGLVDYDDVRFTLEESKKLARGRVPGLDDSHIAAIHESTEGWAAGIILMLEKTHLDRIGPASRPDASFGRVFGYFAGEILDRTEQEVRDFLLKTAFLTVLRVPFVEELTGTASGAEILSLLDSRHYFTERLAGVELAYQYHPLFRAFLADRAAATLCAGELTALQRKTALILEESGDIEEAARLFEEIREPIGLARLVTRHAHELLSQGRNKVVEKWLSAIPGEVVDKDPWLSYWSGMCAFPVDLARTRERLEKAFLSFAAIGDRAGTCLAWAGMIDAYTYSLDEWSRLDEWITRFGELATIGAQRLPPQLAFARAAAGPLGTPPTDDLDLIVSSRMLISLTLRKTDQARSVAAWYDRVSALLRKNPSVAIQMDTMFCMSLYYLWKGEYHKNGILLEKAEAAIRHRAPSPFAIIRIRMMKGIHCWVTAEYDAASRILTEGLDIANESGIHVFDSLLWSFMGAAEMASGQMEAAKETLARQRAASLEGSAALDAFFYHLNSAWYAALKGDPFLAAENMEAISDGVLKMGTPYYKALWNIGMAQVAYLLGQGRNARTFAGSALGLGLSMRSHVIEWYARLVEAYLLLEEGERQEGLAALGRALSLGRSHGYVHLEFYQPKIMRSLCAWALEEDIETAYVKGLIRRLRLSPPASDGLAAPPFSFESWPYPIRVYTLGRFQIVRDDSPLEFTGKLQKKPLEMLKAIIAFGCVNVSEESLIDALWPEAEGDLAHKSFEMTLSRLRRLLGGENLVRYRGGLLSIDASSCWVDGVALDHMIGNPGRSGADRTIPLCEKAIALYEGPFLPSDTHLPWTARRREALKNSLLRAVTLAGGHAEQGGQWELAAQYYRSALEADDLAEEFYRRLMVCYQKLGNHADAARTYERCRRQLQEHLGIGPSSETEAAYSSLFQSP